MSWWSSVREVLSRPLAGRPAPQRADSAPQAHAAVTQREPAWPHLRVVQRVLADPLTPTAPLDVFRAGLAAHQNPSFLAPLGHAVSADMSGGLVNGLADLAPVTPHPYRAAGELAVPALPRKPVVQRRTASWPSFADGSPDADEVSLEPWYELPTDAGPTVFHGTGAPEAPLAQAPSAVGPSPGEPSGAVSTAEGRSPEADPQQHPQSLPVARLHSSAIGVGPNSAAGVESVWQPSTPDASAPEATILPPKAPEAPAPVAPLTSHTSPLISATPLRSAAGTDERHDENAPGSGDTEAAESHATSEVPGEIGLSQSPVQRTTPTVLPVTRSYAVVPDEPARRPGRPETPTQELTVSRTVSAPPPAFSPPGELAAAPDGSAVSSPKPLSSDDTDVDDAPVGDLSVAPPSASGDAPLSGFAATISTLQRDHLGLPLESDAGHDPLPPADGASGGLGAPGGSLGTPGESPFGAPGWPAPAIQVPVQRDLDSSGPAEHAHAEPAHIEPAHTEPAHTEPAHTEPAHTGPAHTEPAQPTTPSATPSTIVSTSPDAAGPLPIAQRSMQTVDLIGARPPQSVASLSYPGTPSVPAAPVVQRVTFPVDAPIDPVGSLVRSQPSAGAARARSAANRDGALADSVVVARSPMPESDRPADEVQPVTTTLHQARPINADYPGESVPFSDREELRLPTISDGGMGAIQLDSSLPLSERSVSERSFSGRSLSEGSWSEGSWSEGSWSEGSWSEPAPVPHSAPVVSRTISTDTLTQPGRQTSSRTSSQPTAKMSLPIVQRRLLPPPAAAGSTPTRAATEHAGVSFAAMFTEPEDAGPEVGYTTVELTAAELGSAAAGPTPAHQVPVAQRQEDAATAESAAPESAQPAPAALPPAPAAAPAGGGPASTDVDELARRLFEPLSARLRAELWLDRERAGLVCDVRP